MPMPTAAADAGDGDKARNGYLSIPHTSTPQLPGASVRGARSIERTEVRKRACRIHFAHYVGVVVDGKLMVS